MAFLVQKFGGTSVGTPDRIKKVADRIARAHRQGDQLVVVVSAMGHTTDELIALAHQISTDPPHREMDMLLTAGERISMALLSMALSDRGVSAVSFTGSQSGIMTDTRHRRARIQKISGERVKQAIGQGQVAIVAGFQGVSSDKEITTLGRGGSDTTAVALAATLGSDRCEIFSDVDGVFSADPRLVTDAKLWDRIPYELMVEMSVLGAGVLHPRSVEMARSYGVVVSVRNSLQESPGTEIVSRRNLKMEDYKFTAVTSDEQKVLVEIELARPTVMSAILDLAAEKNLVIIMPTISGEKLSFFAELEAEADWKKVLSRLATDDFVRGYVWNAAYVPVSVVGERFSQDGRALSAIFDGLSLAGVIPRLTTSSALSVTFAVPRTHAQDCVRALHEKFFGGTSFND